MDFAKFIEKRSTYSLANVHPVFAYKCILAIMYWMDEMEIDYVKTEKDGNLGISVTGGVTITTEDIGDYICFDYLNSYPKKVDIYRGDDPIMLCTAEDQLDELYLARFAPGLYTLIGDYNKLDGFNRYISCSDEVRTMLKNWIDIDDPVKMQVDVLFIVGTYNMKEIASKVLFGKELVILEYEIESNQSLRLTKSDVVITIEGENIIVNGIEETI